jgi:hypothetical protein
MHLIACSALDKTNVRRAMQQGKSVRCVWHITAAFGNDVRARCERCGYPCSAVRLALAHGPKLFMPAEVDGTSAGMVGIRTRLHKPLASEQSIFCCAEMCHSLANTGRGEPRRQTPSVVPHHEFVALRARLAEFHALHTCESYGKAHERKAVDAVAAPQCVSSELLDILS